MLAAANCAEDDAPPPPELEYAWQSQSHQGALPNSGGLRNQPVALMAHMRVAYNIWYAFDSYIKSNYDIEWVKNNKDLWNIVCQVKAMKEKKETKKGEEKE